jgi:hypothetical protein
MNHNDDESFLPKKVKLNGKDVDVGSLSPSAQEQLSKALTDDEEVADELTPRREKANELDPDWRLGNSDYFNAMWEQQKATGGQKDGLLKQFLEEAAVANGDTSAFAWQNYRKQAELKHDEAMVELVTAYQQAWLEHCLPLAEKIIVNDFVYSQFGNTINSYSPHWLDTAYWMDAQLKSTTMRLHKEHRELEKRQAATEKAPQPAKRGNSVDPSQASALYVNMKSGD